MSCECTFADFIAKVWDSVRRRFHISMRMVEHPKIVFIIKITIFLQYNLVILKMKENIFFMTLGTRKKATYKDRT